ncbi:MAG: restriction endonuclease subunit S [Cyanobacteriota bacterium]|jgi:type I restriction enzyme S subunit
MSHHQVPLGAIADLIRGITYKPTDVCDANAASAVACMRTKNVQEALDESDIVWIPDSLIRNPAKYLKTGDILVSSANSWNLVGKGCWVPELKYAASAGGFISILRGNPHAVDLRYLYHWFVSPQTQAKLRSYSNKTTNISNLDHGRTLATEIPLPPLEEQRRIAAILDKCSAIQAADRERRETLGRFQASYFHHLFGEPSAVSDNWPLKTVESCSTAIQTGPFGSLLHQSDYIQGGIPILNPKHIANGVIACGENETIGRDKAGEMILYQLEKGDVLLARRGEMGRCAVVTSKEDGWLCGTGSMFIRPLGGTLAPEYLCALLSSQYMRSRLEKIAIGITLLNLNANIVGDLLIPVPPIALQHRYAAVLARLSALGDLTTRSALARSTATASIQNKLLTAAGS